MEVVPGSLGTSASLALRLGQAIFAVASLLFMCLDIEFYSYTSYCVNEQCMMRHRMVAMVFALLFVITLSFYSFLVTIMGLVIPWSLTLAVVDVFSVIIKRPARQPGILSIVVIGDWILSFLSLAASCSTASVTSLLLAAGGFCSQKLCTRYQLSAAMAFLSWFLSLASTLFNLWLLPSMVHLG